MLKQIAPLPFLLLLFAGGCDAAPGSAESVARDFWAAMMDGDKAAAQRHATQNSIAELELEPAQAGERRAVEFGSAEEVNGQVSIPTTLITRREGAPEERVPLHTILVREAEAWKVDWNQTLASMLGGMMGEMMRTMTEAMKGAAEEMGKSFEQMGKSFEEAMQAPPPAAPSPP